MRDTVVSRGESRMLYIDKINRKTDIKGKPYLLGDYVFSWGVLDGEIDIRGHEVTLDRIRTKPYDVFGFNLTLNNLVGARYFVIRVKKSSLNETLKLEFNGDCIVPCHITESSALTYTDCNDDLYTMINDSVALYYEIPEGVTVAQLVFNPDMKRYKEHQSIKGKPTSMVVEFYLADEVTALDKNEIPVNMIKSANWKHLSDTGAVETIDVNSVKFSAAAFDLNEGDLVEVFNKSEFVSKVSEDYRYVKLTVDSPFDDDYVQKTAKKPEDIKVFVNGEELRLVNGYGVSMMNGMELYYEMPNKIRKQEEKDVRITFPAQVINTNYDKKVREKYAVLEVGQDMTIDLHYVKKIS